MNRIKQITGILVCVLMILTLIPTLSFGAGLPFTDVSVDAWYYGDVKGAYDTGLINGRTDTGFAPEADMTYAEAVKLAACMHQKYTSGSVTLENGSPSWYDSYVAYSFSNGIIEKDYTWNQNATRAGYVEIFAHALPDSALTGRNSIADGSIPDVAMSHPQAAEIYKLYRAGVLTGTDSAGTFRPDSNIKRAEVSAILTRMMDESARKDLTLTGNESGETFTVRFNSNGGSTVRPQYVAENGTAVQPADPGRTGYVFAGWYRDTALTKAYSFGTPVTADIMLYAKWSTVGSMFAVQFDTDGGNEIPTQYIPANGQVKRPADPVREAYKFAGWYQDSTYTQKYDFVGAVVRDLTLYAKWEAYSSYTVQFDTDGGSEVAAQLISEYGKVEKPAGPVREGYDFSGWYLNSEKTRKYSFDIVVKSDLTLYAKWVSNGKKGTISDSWEEIIASVHDGTYKTRYKIGDTKSVYLSDEGYVEMQIVAFDADELADGSGNKAAVTWLSKQVLPTLRQMNPITEVADNQYKEGTGAVGGWEKCEIRNVYMKELAEKLPSEVRSAVKPVIKYSMSPCVNKDGILKNENDVPTVDALWIPSYREVIGHTCGANSLESKGPVYAGDDLFSDSEARIKHVPDDETYCFWWLRSAEDYRCFYCVGGNAIRNSIIEYEDNPFIGGTVVHNICFGFCM